MVRRFLVLICTLALAVSLLACGNDSASGEPSKETEKVKEEVGGASRKDTLNIAIEVDSGTLAPVYASENQGFAIYDTLYEISNTPMLATDWEDVDETHRILHIREGVKDTAGNTFTANDVIYSLNYAATDTMSALYTPSIDLENMKAVDEYTVEIALKEPDITQWILLANVRMFTQASMEACDDGMITTPLGTGAYKLVEYIPSSSIKLEVNENYWGGEVPFKYVNYYVISEQAQRAVALESGQVDVAFNLSASDHLRLQKDEKYNMKLFNISGNYALHFNCSEYSVCKNKDLRKAICYAVDNNAISQIVFSGLAPASQFTFLNEGTRGADASWCEDYYNCDLDKAKELLKQAGISTGTKLVIGCQASKSFTGIAEVVQGMLLEIGFDASIVSYESATWNEAKLDPKNGLDIVIDRGGSPDDYYGTMARGRFIRASASHYENQELFALINESTKVTEEEKQLEINKQIHDIIYEECPYYNLVDNVQSIGHNTSVSGVAEMLEHDNKAFRVLYLHP